MPRRSFARSMLAAVVLVACTSTPPSPDVVDGATSADATDATDAAVDVPTDTADSGPAVGVTMRMFVDTTRGTPANGDAGATTTRQLPTDIFYPSTAFGVSPLTDAPADTTQLHPLVLFVHGSSSSRAQSRFLLQAIASAGYIAAAADFPLTALATPGGASDLHVDDQLGDLRFLADQLAAASQSPTDSLAHAIDASAYVVIGHSTGGTVTLLSLFAPDMHDARVRGGIALAPCACFFADTFFRTRALPLLVMAGTSDLFVPIANNGARAYMLAQAPRALVTLLGGTHLYFTDLRIDDGALSPMPTSMDDAIATALARYGGAASCRPVPPPGTDPRITLEQQHARTVAWVRGFLDQVLRQRAGALAGLENATDPLVTVMHDGL